MNFKRILIPTDFSETAHKALEQALILSAQFKAELTVLHARLLYEDDASQLPGELAKLKHEEEEMEEHLLEYMKGCTDQHGHLQIQHEIVRGYSAPSAILGYINQHEFDLVVIGTHGRSGLEHFLIGSVAEKVVRYAPCPVLTISQEATVKREFKKLLLPFDFSEHTLEALRSAVELAALNQAQLELFYVIDEDVHPALYSWGMKSLLDMVPDIKAKAEARMDEILSDLKIPDTVTIIKTIVAGVPHKEIARHASENNFDLIIMATHGLVGLDRFLLGSTTERIIRSVHKPILTLKEKKLI